MSPTEAEILAHLLIKLASALETAAYELRAARIIPETKPMISKTVKLDPQAWK